MKTALAVIAVLIVQISRPSSVLSLTTVAAQSNRAFFEIGAGTLSPTDPAIVTLSLRATAGWILGGQNAISAEYSRQSANRSEGNDLGKFSRHFVGIAWQHAFHDVFSDQEPMKQQYLLRVSGGAIFRGTFPEAVGDQNLRNAPYVDVGLVIRYPFSSHIAVVGTVEDAIGFLPAETVSSYCMNDNNLVLCYPEGGSQYYTFDLPANTQHNFGVLVSAQLRL